MAFRPPNLIQRAKRCRETVALTATVGLALALLIVFGCRSQPRPAARVPPPAATATTPEKDSNANAATVKLASHQGQPEPIPPPEPPRVAEPIASPNTTAPEQALTFDAAMAIGMANNPRLREAAARAEMARANADIAFAPFLPTVGANYRYSAFSQPVIPGGAFVPASLTGGATSYNIAEAGIQWTLYDFGRTSGRYGAAVDRAQIAEMMQTRARQTVAFEIAQAYFMVLSATSNLHVREQAVAQAEAILHDTRARRLGGVAEREDVLRAEVEAARAKEVAIAARQALRDAESSLNYSLGWPANAPVRATEVANRPEFGLSLEECMAWAADTRREIRIGRETVAAASRDVQTARGDMLPRIYTRATVLRADSPGPINGMLEGVGLHVDQVLYSGGERRGELRRSYAQVSATRASLQSILDQVSLQVRVAFEAIDTNRQRIHLGETTVAQAQENLRLVTVRYNNGTATPTDIVDAQTALTWAATSYNTAIYGYLTALAQLEYALGNDQRRLVEQLRHEAAAP